MKFKERLRSILGVRDTPRRTAMAFSTGVFIGMSPLLGLHTVLALLVAWLFRLNKLAAITGVYVTNPWSIVPIYTFSTWVGTLVLGMDRVLPEIDWNHMTVGKLFNELSHLLLPFVIGTTLVAAVSAVLAYFVVFRALKRERGTDGS